MSMEAEFSDTATAPIAPETASLGPLAHVEAELSVVIGRARRPIRDLLSLRAGSLLTLDGSPGDLVDVLANGTLVARGHVVVVEGDLGVRVVEIVNGSESP